MGFNFYKLILLNNKIEFFKISFLFINLIYKIVYKKVIILIFTSEAYVEKSIIKIYISNIKYSRIKNFKFKN